MILSFTDEGTEDVFEDRNTKASRSSFICIRWTDRGPTEVEIADYHR